MYKNKKGLKTIASLDYSKIQDSVFAFRPDVLNRASAFFVNNFQGNVMYAVKTNPDETVLKSLYNQGVSSFDVASLEEIKKVRKLFSNCTLYFMHPVKSRYAIKEAYHKYGVRHFSLDSEAELHKILDETNNADDLCLHVRLAIPNSYAELELSAKFGVNLQKAAPLITKVDEHASKIGICFHAGSQCMHSDAYRIAIRMAGEVIEQTTVKFDYFNVGGGFPSIYPGLIPPDLQSYFDAIHDEFSKLKGSESMQLLAEPGRALVAECMSLIVRVDMRKRNTLYINDGTYGSLFDAGTPQFIFPAKLICDEQIESTDLAPFSFYGPTCDSMDFMKGPFYLPSDTAEGDYIEIGQMGAYSSTMATGFNGFKAYKELIHVSDEPLMTMYGNTNHMTNNKLEVIAA